MSSAQTFFAIGFVVICIVCHYFVKSLKHADQNFDDLLDEDEFQKEENLGI